MIHILLYTGHVIYINYSVYATNNVTASNRCPQHIFSTTSLHHKSLFCHSSKVSKGVVSVVPQTLHSLGCQFAYVLCTTTYSTTSFSFPLPSTTTPFLFLVTLCLLLILTTACLTAAPSIGYLAARLLINFALLLYFTSSQTISSFFGRDWIRARKESYIPSQHILRNTVDSAAEKDEYICLWRARAVGIMDDLLSFMERRRTPVV